MGFRCPPPYVTFRDQAAGSKVVLFGKLARSGPEHNDGTKPRTQKTTDLVISGALKGSVFLAGKKVLTLPEKLVLEDAKEGRHFLLFVDVVKGKLEPYRGLYATKVLGDYLKGLLAIDARDRVGLMRYCFAYLEHQEQRIADDAFHVFLQSADSHVRKVASNLPPGNLRRWIQSEKTPFWRVNFYAYLLGHCGVRKADAALLRKLLDRSTKESRPVDQILIGYTLLDPRAGAACIHGLIAEPTAEFTIRYGGLRAVRYFCTHGGVLTDNEILEAMSLALAQGDMADLAIEYLRQWKCWKLTEKILPLWYKKPFDLPIVRRSIVRYALQCPDLRAIRFVRQLRQLDSAMVKEIEEILELETTAAPGK
jgi:hypothetical protein